MSALRSLEHARHRLPDGFTVRLAEDVQVLDMGALLIGGSPMTAIRLSTTAVTCFAGDLLSVTDPATSRLVDRLLQANVVVPVPGSCPPVQAHQLTVVVPVRDRAEPLERLLRGLAGLACVVVDDASLNRRAVRVVARRHGATVVTMPVNRGPAAARNVGLTRVRTPYVAFVDSDVEVGTDQLLALSRHLADPLLALVGPRIVGVSRGDRPRWFQRYDEQRSSLTLGDAPGLVRPGSLVGWLPSACLVGRTAALGTGFAAELRVGEDVDLVWRLHASGLRVRYAPEVTVAHDTRGTLRSWLGRKVTYGSGAAGLAARHGDNVAPAVMSPGVALAAAGLLSRSRWAPLAFAVAWMTGSRKLARVLPAAPGREQLGRSLALRTLGWGVRQETGLLLRHWWPAAALALPSRTVRRALLSALVVDTAIAIRERPADDPVRLPLVLLARRLDDLAYGTGLWLGAFRAGSVHALAPRRPRNR